MDPILTNPFVGAATLIVVGVLLKRWPQFPNKFIPAANWILAFIGYNIAPKPANGATTLADAIGTATPWLAATIQTLLVTGIFSGWKNVVLEGLLPLLTKRKPG